MALISITLLLCQIHLLHLFPWVDEDETVVAARMMASGSRLYTDVFDQHGPLAFLPGYLLGRLGLATVEHCRVLMLALQCCCIYLAFRLAYAAQRGAAPVWLGCAAIWIACVLPPRFGQAYLYQSLAGALISIALSALCLPSLIKDAPRAKWAFVGSFCLGCLPFLAFTYDPAAILLFAVSFRRKSARSMLLGVVASAAFNLTWLLFCGDLRGYVVEHYYLNIFVLPHYMEHPAWSLKDVAIALFVTIAVVLAGAQSLRSGTKMWRAALFVIAYLTLLCRGLTFQALPAYAFLLPVSAALLYGRAWPQTLNAWMPLVGVSLSLLALICWRPSWEAQAIKTSSPFAQFVDANTIPTDRIISYSFDNGDYLLANRLPASADFFLLPSQIAYDRHPILGFNINACEKLAAARPKIVKLDRWLVYGKFSWNSYANCIERYVIDHYRVVSPDGIYLRNDLTPAASGELAR